MPFVLWAALILLGYRVAEATRHYAPSAEPWVLVGATSGLPAVLARLWIGIIGFGPWLLAVFVVDVASLELQVRGPLDTFAFYGIATAYVATVIVMLIGSAASTVKGLIALRSIARRGSS
jgi:hypothetical protein